MAPLPPEIFVRHLENLKTGLYENVSRENRIEHAASSDSDYS